MQAVERRGQERFRVKLPAVVLCEGPPRDVKPAKTRDVSTSGAFLYTGVRYPVGTEVGIELTIALRDGERFPLVGPARVDLKGSVIRAEAAGVAVAFQERYQMRREGRSESEGEACGTKPVA